MKKTGVSVGGVVEEVTWDLPWFDSLLVIRSGTGCATHEAYVKIPQSDNSSCLHQLAGSKLYSLLKNQRGIVVITHQLKYILASMAVSSAVLMVTACGSEEQNEVAEEPFQYQARLTGFDSCDALQQYLVETAQKQKRLYDYRWTSVTGGPEMLESTDSVSAADGSGAAGTNGEIDQVTGTNNQVTGVDEADFIKTDGEYTYVLSGGNFLIFDTWPPRESEEVSRIELKGYPSHLFVHHDLAWIVSTVYDYRELVQLNGFVPRNRTLTQVSLVDISDKADPEMVRQVVLEGWYSDARKIDNRVHMVVSSYFDIYPLLSDGELPDVEEMLPLLFDSRIENGEVTTAEQVISDCGSIYRPGTANGTGTVSVVSFDLDGIDHTIERQTILSNSGRVYANDQSLYLASMEDDFWLWLPVIEGDSEPRPGTTIHKFSIQGTPRYQASGRVDGHLLNQFSMDEFEGNLRVVTTEFPWWAVDAVPRNTLYVLNQTAGRLEMRSSLSGLGKPGERVYATRFVKDKGFVVTFEQIDPLYTLDLSDPDHPAIAGELEVPGFSTYLHPIADDLMIAVGRNVDAPSVDLSLFDISDFYNPALLHRISIGSGSYSQAEYDHKAFTWFADENLLALPFTRWSGVFDDSFIDYELFNGLQVYRVDQQTGFTTVGVVDHSNFYKSEAEQSWYYPDNIRRSFFVSDTGDNDFLYSISTRGIKVNSVDDLSIDLAALPLPHDSWPTEVMLSPVAEQ